MTPQSDSTSGAPFGPDLVLRFADRAVDDLGEAREEIDALNVYPVPDGDTGTNMFLTMSSARDALAAAYDEQGDQALVDCLRGFARGALLGARGNSGVILSQLIGAFVESLATDQLGEATPDTFATAFADAVRAGYTAVGTPVEGTILSVAKGASAAAAEAASRPPEHRLLDIAAVFEAAAEGARAALARTPEQLPILAQSGVVDAGGRGLVVVLESIETSMTGRRRPAQPSRRPAVAAATGAPGADLTADGPAYEVMYLLDADESAISLLRTTLAGLGDSLVVVGGGTLWNVHVHVDDVGAAIEAGIAAGRPHRIRVTHFAEQIAARGRTPQLPTGRAVVAVSAGAGLEELFGASGAHVVSAAPGARPSVGQLLAAITATAAAEVIVLPNDADTRRAAEVAARTAEEDSGLRVAVLPTSAQVQGLAALAMHDPARSFDQDVLEMTATARHARHGAVTTAAKRALTMAGPCEAGDILGVVEGDFAVVGQDVEAVATEIVRRLLGGGGDLVTLVQGQELPGLAAKCADFVAQRYPVVEVVVYDGGQLRYPLLVGVE